MNKSARKKILLADNSIEYRRFVTQFLESEGYGVTEAESSKGAQEKLESQGFDLLLVNLRMNDDFDLDDISGLEIAKFASERGIPCILLTAFPTVELARTALRSQGAESLAKDLISKSGGAQALLKSIRRFMLAGDSAADTPPPKMKKD